MSIRTTRSHPWLIKASATMNPGCGCPGAQIASFRSTGVSHLVKSRSAVSTGFHSTPHPSSALLDGYAHSLR